MYVFHHKKHNFSTNVLYLFYLCKKLGIEGNLGLNSICAKCDLMCFTNYDLGGWSCLWC
jgi:hypothetical protein